MQSEPRKISKIIIEFDMNLSADEKQNDFRTSSAHLPCLSELTS
jgi:hypothetical protein